MEKIILADNVTLFDHRKKVKGAVEKLGITGEFTMEHRKENGLVEVHKHTNLITNVGFNFIGEVIGNPTQPSEITHLGVGSGVTAANATDTDLETIIGSRLAATWTGLTDTTFEFAATFGAGVSTGAWTEAGVFTAVTAGTMLNHLVFSVVNKGAGDSITATFTFTLS